MKLPYYIKSNSKLIPFAVAVSGKLDSGHKAKLTALRLTNTGERTAAVSFNGGAARLQYRRDDVSVFEDWNLTAALAIAPGEYIEIAGDNSETQGALGRFSMTGDAVAASGNVMSLIYGVETRKDPLVIPEGITFGSMFRDCTSLTAAPELPATALAQYCYESMFSGCTSLTAAPELPATTLTVSCYRYMFNDCKNLTTAPELPATILAGFCYSGMFRDCTSLTAAPELPATTLAANCYYDMFYECTSLTAAPELPATTLALFCYGFMFFGCTSLTAAPELPATALAQYCYESMFRDCTSLTAAPELPATILAGHCYNSMFRDCTSLTAAPELPATILADDCYDGMFYGCANLAEIVVHFTGWGSQTSSWLYQTRTTGIFKCTEDLDTTQRGDSRIPEDWTVEII